MNPFLKWGCLTPLTAVFLLISSAELADKFVPSPVRKALPKTASDIHEYGTDSWFNTDYVRCIKAKLPETDVPTFAKNLGSLTRFDPVADASNASMINMGVGNAPSWWDPPPASASSYFRYTPGKELVETLTYSNGYVYFVSIAW